MTDDVLLHYIKEAKQFKLLTENEEKQLAVKIKAGDRNAVEKLVNANLRLVIKMAKKYARNDSQIMELIQEGNIGLLKATEKFDISFNVKFSSYAIWWVKQSFGRYLNSSARIIKLPVRKEELIKKMEREIQVYESEFGREPSCEQLAKLLDKKYEEVVEIKKIQNYGLLSLDMPLNDNNSSNMYDVIPCYTYSPEKLFIGNEFKENVNKCLGILNDREKDIVKKRYCLDGIKRAVSFKVLGKKYAISAESVRQTQLRAIRKLKKQKALIEVIV